MTLFQTQVEFVKSLTRFYQWLDLNGYEVTLGGAYRPRETALLYEKQGKGIANSLHCDRLAMDLNLFRRGVMLVTKEDYKEAGSYWESLSVPGLDHYWGGRFERVDADHFSIGYNGRR